MGGLFIDPASFPHDADGFFQIIFLLVVYGYILFQGSDLISDGSELLLLIPSVAGIVGSVVLPILGAVPDGAIVLFSGLGPDAQEQLEVGVGALAGSTIMLLTIPWALSIIAGRVNLDASGRGAYKKPKNVGKNWARLSPAGNFSLFSTGVNCKDTVASTGKIMIVTALSYIVIQGPAFALECGEISKVCDKIGEKYWALAGVFLCISLFCGYLYHQIKGAETDETMQAKVEEVRMNALSNSVMSLQGIFSGLDYENALQMHQEMKTVLKPFFAKYDMNKDGTIDVSELRLLLVDLHEDPAQAESLLAEMDSDKSGAIDYDEFCAAMMKIAEYSSSHPSDSSPFKKREEKEHEEGRVITARTSSPTPRSARRMEEGKMSAGGYGSLGTTEDMYEDEKDAEQADGGNEEEDDDDDEEEEIPEDLINMPAHEQKRRILLRSAWMMGVGTVVVLAFSDPMVDVLSETGKRLGIKSFYISFVLAPLASNASELIAAYNYAQKKTIKSISISFATLQGAACMNNTFCLGIFLALVFFRELAWEFSAETVSILFVEVVMLFLSLKKTHRLVEAVGVLCLYPISLCLVAWLESVGFN